MGNILYFIDQTAVFLRKRTIREKIFSSAYQPKIQGLTLTLDDRSYRYFGAGEQRPAGRSIPFTGSKALRGCPGHGFNRNGHYGCAIIKVDVRHRVVSIMISFLIDVVILHEEHHGNTCV